MNKFEATREAVDILTPHHRTPYKLNGATFGFLTASDVHSIVTRSKNINWKIIGERPNHDLYYDNPTEYSVGMIDFLDLNKHNTPWGALTRNSIPFQITEAMSNLVEGFEPDTHVPIENYNAKMLKRTLLDMLRPHKDDRFVFGTNIFQGLSRNDLLAAYKYTQLESPNLIGERPRMPKKDNSPLGETVRQSTQGTYLDDMESYLGLAIRGRAPKSFYENIANFAEFYHDISQSQQLLGGDASVFIPEKTGWK